MKLIVGLGNPEKKHNMTRHNIGFWILDKVLGEVNWKEKFSSLYYEDLIAGEKVIYLKPQTYMNLSGESVVQFCNYFNISVEDVLIIHDDIDMEFGNIKIKKTSSSGGHNGVLSIINLMHSENFYRLKIGINNNKKHNTKVFVLKKFSIKEQKALNNNLNKFSDIIDLFIKNDILIAMNKYN